MQALGIFYIEGERGNNHIVLVNKKGGATVIKSTINDVNDVTLTALTPDQAPDGLVDRAQSYMLAEQQLYSQQG